MIDDINTQPDYGDEPPFACFSAVFVRGAQFACGGTPGHVGKHTFRLDWVQVEWDGKLSADPAQEPQPAPALPDLAVPTLATAMGEASRLSKRLKALRDAGWDLAGALNAEADSNDCSCEAKVARDASQRLVRLLDDEPEPAPELREAARLAQDALHDIAARCASGEAASLRDIGQRALAGLGLLDVHAAQVTEPRPRIVCLCGSTRNYDEFRRANLRLTLAGQIVLSIGCDTKSDGDLAAAGELDIDPVAVKALLDDLHKRKVDLADYVLVVSDEDGYFGQSTAGEIAYAVKHGKPVLFAHKAAAERAKAAGLLPAGMTPCRQPHTPGYRCFDCATDDEIAASIPDSIADHPDDCRGTCCKDALRAAEADEAAGSLEDAGTLDEDPEDDPWDASGRPATQDIL